MPSSYNPFPLPPVPPKFTAAGASKQNRQFAAKLYQDFLKDRKDIPSAVKHTPITYSQQHNLLATFPNMSQSWPERFLKNGNGANQALKASRI